MQLYTIKNTARFMTGLLSEKETAFDQFLLGEAVIMTGNTYTIDGHINRSFYTEEELSDLKQTALNEGRIFSEDMIRWKSAKSYCYECIKGKKLPLSFKISLCLAPENVERFLAGLDTSFTSGQISSLNVNIKYDGSTLTCTTAVSLTIFTMDKSIEHSWDQMFSRFLSSHGYDYD